MVGTTQRSIATMASAWLRRDVRQVCDGGPRRRIMYLETVDSAISNPSLSSSPWMRGAPHNEFSVLIRRMSSRISGLTLGLLGCATGLPGMSAMPPIAPELMRWGEVTRCANNILNFPTADRDKRRARADHWRASMTRHA